jgi:hypothetical protein
VLGDFPALQKPGEVGGLSIRYAQDSERAAYDVTVSPPKDFSMQLLVSEDRRMFEIAREWNRQVMQMFEPVRHRQGDRQVRCSAKDASRGHRVRHLVAHQLPRA